MNRRILGIFVFATALFSGSAFASSHREAPAFHGRETAPAPTVGVANAGELVQVAPLTAPVQIGVVSVVRPDFTPTTTLTNPVTAPTPASR
jgi:hypothetical protein